MFMNFSLYLSLVISLAEPVSVLRNPLYRDRSPPPEAKKDRAHGRSFKLRRKKRRKRKDAPANQPDKRL
jgi:hypothetical protein